MKKIHANLVWFSIEQSSGRPAHRMYLGQTFKVAYELNILVYQIWVVLHYSDKSIEILLVFAQTIGGVQFVEEVVGRNCEAYTGENISEIKENVKGKSSLGEQAEDFEKCKSYVMD